MARTVVDAKLAKREQRMRLEIRKEPYWMTLNEGEHLGYYKGRLVGKWVARFRPAGESGTYQRTTLGQADDHADADGKIIFDFKQAQEAARKWIMGLARNSGRRTGPYTVSDALDDYLADFQGKDLMNTKRRIEAIIRPSLGKYVVTKLDAATITAWHNEVAKAPREIAHR